ncbi:DUF6159 family protein [Halostella salina]|uniref:DUF6159 family protein n=1 Tax=Halostella salina TaxID=1547897 RepID=UPI000EF84BA6|nr:DUF6159 family protein [Halostella salina]
MFGIRSFIQRIRLGLTLTVGGLRVLRNHPKLLVFPLVSGVLSIAFLVALLGPVFLFETTYGLAQLGEAGLWVGLFVVYFGTTFIATFANAALVHAVGESFAGKEPRVVRSLKATGNKAGIIAVWALIAAAVGILIQWLESRSSIAAKVVSVVFSAGWSIATFFVVPVIVFEDTSVTGMFGESVNTFKQTWGESIGAGFGIGLITGLVTVLAVLVAFAVPAVLVPSLGGFAVGGILAGTVAVLGFLVHSALWGVIKTALYAYAETDTAPEEFDALEFETLGGTLESGY